MAHTLVNLLSFLRKNRRKYLRVKGVHYVDIGYKYKGGIKTFEICLRFYVHKKLPRKILKQNHIPKWIEGVKTDILVSNPVKHERIGQPFPVITGGIEIENPYEGSRGTLGSIFKDVNSQLVGLTNYHVLYGDKGKFGDEIIQPAKKIVNDGDIIGTVGDGNPAFDCAFFLLNQKRPSNTEILAASNSLKMCIVPKPGIAVLKSGVATDVTFGIIDGISTDASFTITKNPEKPNQDGQLASVGDSGSIWIADDGSHQTGIGLHFQGENDGSRAYAYSLQKVMASLTLKF